jgi:hypothetical protein
LETGATFESPLAIAPSTKSNTSRSGHMTFQAPPRILIFAKYSSTARRDLDRFTD